MVGVDGSAEGTEALRYAMHAARARGMWLLVVHAYELPPHGSTIPASFLDAAAMAAAYRVTADALSGVRLPEGLEVAAAVELTSPALMLQRLSACVGMIVLGEHTQNPSDFGFARPLTAAVAAGSSCPVVIVPAGWRRNAGSSRSLVVGLHGRPGSTVVLGYAFAEAERQQWTVTVVHALPVGMTTQQSSVESDWLDHLLIEHREAHPGVRVSALVVQGDVAEVMLGASRGARLLVVEAGSPSAARRVMTELRCPLVVVPRNGPEPRGKPFWS